MHGVLTYWRTVRHLKSIQLYGRLRLHFVRARIDARPAPRLRPAMGDRWVRPAEREPSLRGPDVFELLHQTHALSEEGWDNPEREKLWRYNLHYFDDLNAQRADERAEWHRALLQRWVRENPPGRGTGWEPFPTSLRAVNWIKWALRGNQVPRECLHSLAIQVRWLSDRLEIHLLGNHLFANAKALVFAGLFFDGPEADAWLEKGLRILGHEIAEQILSDGGQFERSTMYHALALEDMLDLQNVLVAFTGALSAHWRSVIETWRERIGPMRRWLSAMCHPDGEIGFFNDAAFGIACTPTAIDEYATRLGLPSDASPKETLTHLPSSGYIRIARDASVVLIDVAQVGPDHLPGHAHADTLSFELSLFGQRVFVNSGTSCYGESAERHRQRGTAAHTTVVIDGENSSEVWAGFRVARRAHPFDLRVTRGTPTVVECSHDGYRRLGGRPTHTRQWAVRDDAMTLDDRISGRFDLAEARFHLHPSIRVDHAGRDNRERNVILRLPGGESVRVTFEGGLMRTEATTWHPEFGRREHTLCLIVTFDDRDLRTHLDWANSG